MIRHATKADLVVKQAIKVLIVDDEETLRTCLVAFLEDEGLDVTCATDGEEALKVHAHSQVDVGVIDPRLPGIDGNGVILEAHKICPDMKFLVYTGSVTYGRLCVGPLRCLRDASHAEAGGSHGRHRPGCSSVGYPRFGLTCCGTRGALRGSLKAVIAEAKAGTTEPIEVTFTDSAGALEDHTPGPTARRGLGGREARC